MNKQLQLNIVLECRQKATLTIRETERFNNEVAKHRQVKSSFGESLCALWYSATANRQRPTCMI
jgi:RNAse (barnase) inhibitor barstar